MLAQLPLSVSCKKSKIYLVGVTLLCSRTSDLESTYQNSEFLKIVRFVLLWYRSENSDIKNVLLLQFV